MMHALLFSGFPAFDRRINIETAAAARHLFTVYGKPA
jgi:hypothetical protein